MVTLLWPTRSSPVHAMNTAGLRISGVKHGWQTGLGRISICLQRNKKGRPRGRPRKRERNHHRYYNWTTGGLAEVRVAMVVVRPMLRHPDADLARVPAAVPEVAADQPDLLDTGFEFGTIALFECGLIGRFRAG